MEHFVRKHAQRINQGITYVQKKTLTTLMNWNWPGNVRELEKFVERAMILTQGPSSPHLWVNCNWTRSPNQKRSKE